MPPRSNASARARRGRLTSSASKCRSPPRRPSPQATSSCCTPRPCTAIRSTATPEPGGHRTRTKPSTAWAAITSTATTATANAVLAAAGYNFALSCALACSPAGALRSRRSASNTPKNRRSPVLHGRPKRPPACITASRTIWSISSRKRRASRLIDELIGGAASS